MGCIVCTNYRVCIWYDPYIYTYIYIYIYMHVCMYSRWLCVCVYMYACTHSLSYKAYSRTLKFLEYNILKHQLQITNALKLMVCWEFLAKIEGKTSHTGGVCSMLIKGVQDIGFKALLSNAFKVFNCFLFCYLVT